MSALAESHQRRKLWNREEVHCLPQAGLLGGHPFELLDGEIVYKTSNNPAHVRALRRSAHRAEMRFGAAFVRTQDPLIRDLLHEPEPDLLVTLGPEEEYTALHPTAADARLVIEVSDATLDDDLGARARRYARAGVAEFWVLELQNRCLHRHTVPEESGFRSVLRLAESNNIEDVAVSELLSSRE